MKRQTQRGNKKRPLLNSGANAADTTTLFNNAQAAHRAGRLKEARAGYKRVLKANSRHFEATHMLGVIALQRQQYKGAISFIEKSISQTENPSSAQLSNLGEAYRRAGDTLRGRDLFCQAVELDPANHESRFNLGLTSLDLNDAEGAVEAFTKLLELVPTAVDLWPHLAEAYLKAGRKEQATEAFETTLTYEPNNIAAINNLAILRKNDGRIAEAIDLYRQATDIEPHVAVLHANLGVALEESGALANALEAFETAIHCAPDEPEWHIYRGSILQQLGRVEDTIVAYTDAQERDSDNLAAAWGSKLALPVVYETPEEIEKFYKRWREGVTELNGSVILETPGQIEAAFDVVLANPNFLLHYQGGIHRDDQEAYGALVFKIVNAKYPALAKINEARYESRAGERPRIGFISSNFFNHSIGKIMGPWATMLDAQKFEVHVWHLGLTIDDVTKSIQTNVEHFHHAPQFSSNLPDIIAETAHDVIVFTDIGMDPIIQVLAALRLAPIQINGLGHPVASGLPTVDYVFGSELMEPADAQEHYTEELVLVPNLLWYHDSARIKVPALDADTAMQGKVIYLCSQSLFKLLPQYDDIYARIAERVENSEFWFIRHRSDYVNNLFERRLERAFAAHGLPYREFVVMQPRQDSDGFMRLNAAADILLDSFIWSGNVSTLEGIACGLPVITCPGPHCRSRHTYGILKLLEIEELIANSSDEYVNLAIRLGTDRAWREEMVAKFNTRKSRAYDDDAPVVAMSAFFDQICG